MLARLILVLCMLASGAAMAQIPPLIRSNTTGSEAPVRVQSAAMQTVISGGMAETTVKLVFYNPNTRQLEGDLQFPLGEAQQVTGFALDVGGELRPAVPIEKERGRQILEAEERRRIDPALLEQTQGNNFKLRIYPIPGKGTRTVELKYAAMLVRQQKNWSYRLPLKHFSIPVALDVRVMASEEAPVAIGLPDHFARAESGGWQMEVAKAKGEILLRVPAAQDKPKTYVEEFNGQQYFLAEVPVPAERKQRTLPRVVGLLWDSSSSGAHRALKAEMRVLASYLEAAGNVEVRLVRLRDKAEPVKVIKLAKGQSGILIEELESTIYDGASALADWQPQPDVDEYLMFSDGLRNYGVGAFPQLAKGRRLFTLSSSAGADIVRLAAWANANGGRHIAIDPVDAHHASQELLTDGVRVTGATGMLAGDVVVDESQVQAGLLRVAGKVRGREPLVVTLDNQGRKYEVSIDPASDKSAPHPLAAWWWANRRIAQLEGNYELNRAAIRRLGLEFGLLTRETSLLVLEQLEDYVRHDVAPPQKYRAAFEKMKAENRIQLTKERVKQLDNVVQEFQAKVAWWEKPFPKKHPPAAKKEAMADMRIVEAPMMEAMPPPAPSPMMAARPVAPAAAAPMMVDELDIPADKRINGGASIRLKAWQPDAAYTARMRKAAAGDMYRIYLDERPSHTGSSAFLLDVAGLMLERGQRDLGLRVLSNLAEMELENRHVLRVLAYRLMEAGAPRLAVPLLERVQEMAEEEPQSFRDLGLALAASGQEQRAIEQLYQVVLRPWDGRFAEVELIALAELNSIVARGKAAGRTLDTRGMDSRLLRNLPVDLRVVLTWDADNSDMDLHVIDPDGERAYYGYQLTYQGGRMSRDFTGGYGPEEFMLRNAKPGIYRIEVNYYGSAQQIVTGATTLQLHFTTGFGTQKADDKMVTLRLKEQGSSILVGEFEVKPK